MGIDNYLNESSRDIPIIGKFDLIVVGGGIAGVTAAVAAARNSLQVCLIEKNYGMGGLATLGNVTMWLPLCDGKGHQVTGGLGEELLKLSVVDLKKNNPEAGFVGIPECWLPGGEIKDRSKRRYRTDFNPAGYMFALEELIVSSGVKLLYDTRFCAVQRDAGIITHVIIENKNGRSAIACDFVIDATGDADVCFAAEEETISTDTNVLAAWFYTFRSGKLKRHLFSNKYSSEASKEGAQGPFFRGDDAESITNQIVETREKIRKQISQIRDKDTNTDVQLIMPSTIACMRMTRRLIGKFIYSEKYMHRWFEDTIGLIGDWRKSGPVFAIPFRSLCGKRNNNLLAVGRCISVDNSAWDVIRVYSGCTVTGEAAGTAAAMAIKEKHKNVNLINNYSLQEKLEKQGVILNTELLIKKD
jgi:hypothetical protein